MSEYIDEISNTNEKFAIGMIDIDLFKKVNDTYGHDIGDKVIVHLSEILTSSTNHKDTVARFGGEEFCVVLKNVNRFSAVDIFERLREEVEKTAVYSENGEEIGFTISIGVVMSSEESFEDTISQADMMLYKAKQEGRNRVVLD
jgi:diguanylate cyclase (GGDEF)-like protein